MKTFQIIFNTESKAITFHDILEGFLNKMHKKGTNKFTYYIKHPTEDKWAVRLHMTGRYHRFFKKKLTEDELSRIVPIANGWIERQEGI